jgi:hypothetical protein
MHGDRFSATALRNGLAIVFFVASCGSGGARATDAREAGRVDPRGALCATVEAGATPSFEVIQALFTQDCSSCHATGDDLNLSAGIAWGNLVNHPAPPTESCGGILVVPGDPSSSYLYQKLSNDKPCQGTRMPRSELGVNPLPSCAIDLVRSWIAAGAAASASDGGGQ